MITQLDSFRNILDDLMLPAMHSRVILWGNDYSGRFLAWYANYYHSINVDYWISLDMKTGQSYEEDIYRKTVLDFNYKDTMNAILWVSESLTDDDREWLSRKGFKENKNLVDFYEILKRENICNGNIQFMSALEYIYGCDFLQAIETNSFTLMNEHAHAYRCTTQKEIFPILDKCHCVPKENDAIFDFGCGKGSALVSFLDYGFEKIGGIEFEPDIYNTCLNNFSKLSIDSKRYQIIKGNAQELEEELDDFNWFYFFSPFDKTIFSSCVNSIKQSIERKRRKIKIISISPESNEIFIANNEFRLTNQFAIPMRQRVVDIYESL